MDRDVLWKALRWTGLEHLAIQSSVGGGILADGLIIADVAGAAVRLGYAVRCDPAWCVRTVEVEVLPEGPTLRIASDGEGHWRDLSGKTLPALSGALDVDISLTPFTNTLPIRRLGLATGESASIRVAYVDPPSLDLSAADQRYTCIESGPDGCRYLYESGSFRAELTVDPDGLVIDYADLWARAGDT
jgi:hypothetical protein